MEDAPRVQFPLIRQLTRPRGAMNFLVIGIFGIAVILVSATASFGQAIQAARGVVRETSKVDATDVDRLRRAAGIEAEMRAFIARLDQSGDADLIAAAKRVIDAAESVSNDYRSDEAWDALMREVVFLRNLDAFKAKNIDPLTMPETHKSEEEYAPSSAAFKTFPDVSFIVGYGFSAAKNRGPVNGAVVATNLVGVAVGSLVGVVGADALQQYFVDNTAVGIVLPAHGGDKPSVDWSIGLGQLRKDKLFIWPVIGIQQFNKGDERIPDEVSATNPDQSTWAAPYVGASFYVDLGRDAQALETLGKVFFISVGLELPFYYPGNAGSGLGALFTENGGDYIKEGSVGFMFSITVPLMPIAPKQGDSSGEQ